MTYATYTSNATPGSGFGGRVASLLARMFAKYSEAREREARRLIAQHLSHLDEATLKDLGYSRVEINNWSR